MITFKGTQKEFFKAYPKEKRSLNEVYKLVNSSGEVEYKFVGGLGEKNLKKVDVNNKNTKKVDVNNKNIYKTWNDFDCNFDELYETLLTNNVVTEENCLSFQYISEYRKNKHTFIFFEGIEGFFIGIYQKIKEEAHRKEWEKLYKSFVYLLKKKKNKKILMILNYSDKKAVQIEPPFLNHCKIF